LADKSVSQLPSLSDNQFLIFDLVDAVAPTFSDLSISSTLANYTCRFNANFSDAADLLNGQYIFGTNNTGLWVWDPSVNFTSTPQTVSITKILNSTIGATVGYSWNFTDSSGNFGTTGLQTIITTGYGLLTSTDAYSKINPSYVTACYGGNLEYNIGADKGNQILKVLVDESPV
jgi:hypothetical protein